MLLRFGPDDLPWISGYLHDSTFEWEDVTFDPGTKTLTVQLNRPCHESPERRRFLGIIPVIRFRTVPAILSVRNVGELSSAFRHEHAKDAGYRHGLIALTIDSGVLIVASDGATLRARLEDETSMELRDVGPPSSRPRITDLFARVNRFEQYADALQRLRADT